MKLRDVVASIEDQFGGRLKEEGLDGYSFLDKIVQILFCFPDLAARHKQNFLKKIVLKEELDQFRVYDRLMFYLILIMVIFKVF